MTSSSVSIRVATTAELEAVAGLWLALLEHRADYHPCHGGAPDGLPALVEELERGVATGDILVQVTVEPSGRVVGACVGSITERPPICAEHHLGSVDLLYVRPGQRDQGIGRTMLRSMVEALRAGGAERVEATLCAENSDAIRFFERSRFELHTVTLTRTFG